jgi:hypothetical protein
VEEVVLHARLGGGVGALLVLIVAAQVDVPPGRRERRDAQRHAGQHHAEHGDDRPALLAGQALADTSEQAHG